MDREGFPVLKDTVKIKRMKAFCWVVDTAQDDGMEASPIEAFLLSLCQGAYDVSTLKYVVAETLRRQIDQVSALVENTIKRFQAYLDWSIHPATLNARYNPEHFLYDRQSSQLHEHGRFDSPIQAVLVLTHACNFRCVYCFNNSGKRGKSELTTEEWLDVVDQAKAADVVKLTVSGGEPMLHPGFFPILKKTIESDIGYYICTNGTFIEKREARALADLGVSYVQISLDAASEETHDIMSGVRGTYGRVLNALQVLASTGIDVGIKAVITPINLSDVGKLIDMCHQMGAKRLVLDRFDPSIAGRGDTGLFLSAQQESEVAALVATKQKETENSLAVSAVTGPRYWKRKDDIIRCGALKHGMTILPNGNVSVCEKLIDVPELFAGNVRRESIQDIWESHRAAEIVNPPTERVGELCRSCEHFDYCRTGCYALSLVAADNPYAADPRCWKAKYSNNLYTDPNVKGLDNG